MICRAAAPDLPRRDQHLRAPAPVADERSGQRHRDPRAAAPTAGPARQLGQPRFTDTDRAVLDHHLVRPSRRQLDRLGPAAKVDDERLAIGGSPLPRVQPRELLEPLDQTQPGLDRRSLEKPRGLLPSPSLLHCRGNRWLRVQKDNVRGQGKTHRARCLSDHARRCIKRIIVASIPSGAGQLSKGAPGVSRIRVSDQPGRSWRGPTNCCNQCNSSCFGFSSTRGARPDSWRCRVSR